MDSKTEIAAANFNIAFANFDSPMHAFKFLRNQRRHPMMGHKEQQGFIVDGMGGGTWFAHIQPDETQRL